MRRGVLIAGSAALWATVSMSAAARAADHDRPSDTPRAEEGRPTPDVSTEYFTETHDGFHVAYHPAARERVREVVPILSKMREELSRALGVPVLEEVELRVASVPVEVDHLAPPRASTISAHGGFSFPERKLVIVSLGGSELAGEGLEASLRHHLAHLAILEATAGRAVPVWFEEGFAVYFAQTDRWDHFAKLEGATLSGDPPSLAELAERRGGARTEALSVDFVRFADSERALPALFEALRDGEPFEDALERAFGTDVSGIDRAWRRDTTRRYGVYPFAILAAVLVGLLFLVRFLRKRSLKRPAPSRLIHRRSRIHARRREMKIKVPVHIADQEVPRVEHDGRWHTLH